MIQYTALVKINQQELVLIKVTVLKIYNKRTISYYFYIANTFDVLFHWLVRKLTMDVLLITPDTTIVYCYSSLSYGRQEAPPFPCSRGARVCNLGLLTHQVLLSRQTLCANLIIVQTIEDTLKPFSSFIENSNEVVRVRLLWL